jgi:magnesium chelatase family protein
MIAHVYACALRGIDAELIRVEVEIQSRGLPGWNMVGLLETAVKEARDRVGSAIRNSGFAVPNRRTIINLAPADIKKGGAHYDLSIAIGLLTASGICRSSIASRFLIAGELSLNGDVLPISGTFLMSQAASQHQLDGIIVPAGNAAEAKLAGAETVVPVSSLAEAVEFINEGLIPDAPRIKHTTTPTRTNLNFSDVRGQPLAKRGMEIAAAGGHNVALKGPPGTGKTMLAERLPSILPPLSHDEAIDVLKIRSWHGLLKAGCQLPSERPFRSPHHTASYAGLIGGSHGSMPRLGEISLAHNGVLFLDEMAEFRKDVLEVMRQPLEAGRIRIVRAGMNIDYPSRFMLVAAFNPCRCGFYTHPKRPCSCSINQIRNYRSKLSGPLMDRIDLHIEVGPPPHEALLGGANEENSSLIRTRVIKARERQISRRANGGRCNAQLSGREISKLCTLGSDQRALIRKAASELHLSARSIHRIMKVAKTIADLESMDEVSSGHISEAIQFRPRMDEI